MLTKEQIEILEEKRKQILRFISEANYDDFSLIWTSLEHALKKAKEVNDEKN